MIGIVCMVMIANLQYGWTLFVHPMNVAHGWAVADIQIAFSIFVALETWLTPIEGWIVDRIGARNGPRLMIAFGGVLVRCMRPASATRSSGFPTAAGSPSG
jgi:OFA family oxalate/formate antiporter-like MFS transporter